MLSVLATTAALSVIPVDTSLATVPVAYFGGNAIPRGEENIDMLAKMRLVTIEKWEGPCWTQCVENKNLSACHPTCDVEQYIMGTLKKVKAKNPKTACSVYLNTLLAFPFYSMTGKLADANALTIDAKTKKPIMIQNDQGEQNIPVFGFDTDLGVQMYVDAVKNFSATGIVDGFFGDKWDLGASPVDKHDRDGLWKICNKECGYVTAEQGQAWNDGKKKALSTVASVMGDGPYYMNGGGFDGFESNFQGYKGEWQKTDPRVMIDYVTNELKTKKYVWFSTGDQHWNKDPNSEKVLASGCTDDCLARFLIAVEEGCILGANGWADEYDYPLGNPTGPAVFQEGGHHGGGGKGTLTRTFESGTKVVFTFDDLEKGTGSGTVTWGKQA